MVTEAGLITCDCGDEPCNAFVEINNIGLLVEVRAGWPNHFRSVGMTPASARALITRLEEAIVIAEGRAKGEEE